MKWKSKLIVGLSTSLLIVAAILILKSPTTVSADKKNNVREIHLAVEFVDHAAAAFIALAKGWYEQEGLKIKACDSYVTGMALAAALARDDIDAAYICLAPALAAFKNGGVDLRIVAGTHLYGYGLTVDPTKVKTAADLEKPEVRIGCPMPGSPVDLIMNRVIEHFGLDRNLILSKIMRMPPPKVLLALRTGRIDAGFCSEQFPSMGAAGGHPILIRAADVWPDMQGSVLIVRKKLIDENPEIVAKLVKVTQKSLDFINEYPVEAGKIVAEGLSMVSSNVFPQQLAPDLQKLKISSEVITLSLTREMICTSRIDPTQVQATIDYMAKLDYLKPFQAAEILCLKFLPGPDCNSEVVEQKIAK